MALIFKKIKIRSGKIMVTAAMVKELREITSAGMLDCQKALKETDGMYHHTNIVREQRAICICGESAVKKKSMRM